MESARLHYSASRRRSGLHKLRVTRCGGQRRCDKWDAGCPTRYTAAGAPVENFVRGWHATSVDKLVKPGIGVGDGAYEQAVFYAIRHNISACDLADSMFGFNKRDIGTICYGGQIDLTGNFPYEGPLYKDYATAKMVFDLWQAMDGDNAPLRRYVTGTRYWDFNLDGLANYGLLPDFLQDLRNVGINAAQMDALFESAEDYIEMWEKSEAASARVPKLPVNIARPPPISR